MKKDMLGILVRKIVDIPDAVLGILCDLAEKLSGEVGAEWLAELKKFLRKEKCWTGASKKVFLRLISAGENLILDACDGNEVLADASDTFSYIDSDFKKWGADERGKPTAETLVDVHKMENDGTFVQLFGSLNPDLDRLCFTQAQVKGFVRKYRSWLRTDGYATFFLFKSRSHFFVARVCFYSVGFLRADVRRLGHGHIWDAEARHRLVAPKLA